MKESFKKKVKIVMLIDAWFPHVGGGQIHVWELSKHLADLGQDVTILTRDLGSWNKKYQGVNIVRVGHFKKFSNIIGRLEYLILAYFYLLKNEADIVHLHAFSPGLIAPLIKPFKNSKIVFTAHGKGVKIVGMPVGGGFLEDLVFYKIKYDLLITVAQKTLTKKTRTKKVVVLPNGVNLKDFSKAQRKRQQINNILYVGRLSREKGVDLLINAFRKINNDQIKLTVVGDGAEMTSLKKISEDKRITFTGQLIGDKLIDEFKKADLLVLSSRTEGHPVVLFEAWASKLPILVTNVGSNKGYIRDSINGFLTEPNENAIYQKLKAVLGNKNLLEVTNSAYNLVKNYSWKKIAKETLRQYNWIYEN